MEIYLDNSATTKCDSEVAALLLQCLTEDYGNPSSLHQKGVDAEQYVKKATGQIAKTLHCKEKEIFFTSGGTESNNLALIGAARANKRAGNHIITTQIEHPSVKKTLGYLEEEGYRVTYLPADERGIVSVQSLEEALDDETILVSVMMVNNEIGTIQPIKEMASCIRAKAPKAVFHVDAVQAYGKLPIHVGQLGMDLLSVSGHKIHGPKGVGFLYVREKTKIVPVSFGGGQQKGMRSGTLNVPGIAGIGLAGQLACKAQLPNPELTAMRNLLAEKLKELPEVVINSLTDENAAPHIVNASFTGVRSEVMLHALEDKGIYVSSGSACASHHPSDRSTLMMIGKPQELYDSAIRFSLSHHTTEEEILTTVTAIKDLLPVLRKFTRR